MECLYFDTRQNLVGITKSMARIAFNSRIKITYQKKKKKKKFKNQNPFPIYFFVGNKINLIAFFVLDLFMIRVVLTLLLRCLPKFPFQKENKSTTL